MIRREPSELAGAPLGELPHATDPERLVLSRGNLFSVTVSTGDITPAGATELGLFYEDTRHLSHYELVLPGKPPTLLSSDTAEARMAQVDLVAGDVELAGLLGEPIHFLHIRRKQLLDDELVDQIVFTNYHRRPTVLEFEVHYGADFADVFEVRGARRPARGIQLPPNVGQDQIELRYRGLDGELYRTILRFSPPPEAIEPGRARLRIVLDVGESRVQEIVARPARGEGEPFVSSYPFDIRLRRAFREVEELRRDTTRVESDDTVFTRALDRALTDVFSLRILHDGRWIVGAGIPWFAAPFGRDSILTSTQLLPFAPALAAETLRFLAHHQGRTQDDAREEEPGKIMHELRRGEMARTREVPHSPYYGSVDATPLFVALAGDYMRWTDDRELLAGIWPNVRAAMDWIERRTDGGRRFLTYQRVAPRGLDNQGWKDSRDGVSFPDGRPAEPPIALVEVQGYVASAYRHGAELARVMGEEELAETWRARVEPFLRRLDEAFWNHESRYYAMALDGHGRQVPTLSSNPGHLLYCRAVPEERARRVAEVLFSPEMWSGWGIRTVARGQTVYNPVSYHNGSVWPHDNALAAQGLSRYGLGEQAVVILEALFSATEHLRNQRLPELFCGMARGEREFLVQYPVSCSPQAWAAGALFMTLAAALGLDADARGRRLRIWNPRLPARIGRVELHGMRVGRSRVSLRFACRGPRVHVDVLSIEGESLRVEIEIS